MRPTKPDTPVVVFADVRDDLIARSGSPCDAARVQQLVRERVAVVLCSRRTRAELELLCEDCGVAQPFVCEGGAGLFIPRGYFPFDVPGARIVSGYDAVEFARPYDEVVAALHRAADRLDVPVIGFSDMSIEQVASACGMPLLQARLAKLREYGEPFRVLSHEADRRRLWKALRSTRLTCTPLSPFDEVSSLADGQAAIRAGIALYRRAFGAVIPVRVHGAGEPLADWFERIAAIARRSRECAAAGGRSERAVHLIQ